MDTLTKVAQISKNQNLKTQWSKRSNSIKELMKSSSKSLESKVSLDMKVTYPALELLPKLRSKQANLSQTAFQE